jgi:hypothetical protein
MFSAIRLMVIAFALVAIAMPSIACSQDMGAADTVRISDAVGDIEVETSHPFPVSVSIYNDYDLKTVVIPVIIDGYSGWVRFDSVSYAGGRLDDPNILDSRQVYSFGTDTITVDSLVLKFELGGGSALSAGDGKICDLWLRPIYGGEISMDSLTVSPYGNLQLITTADDQYTPRFQAGIVTIDCDYVIGDLRYSGHINVEDLMGMYKGYLGCFGFDWGDPWHADVNCDRLTDLRDAICLSSHIYNCDSLETLSDCGTYNFAYYNDPGIPDTVWIENDTLYVGRPDTIDIGIINDEKLLGFAFALEWDGSAVLGHGWDYEGDYSAAERLEGLEATYLDHYECAAHDQINPDTLFIATWRWWICSDNIAPGSDAVCEMYFTPLSEGTISFRLVDYYMNYSYALTRGGESMLVTEDKAAILPVLVGGNLTVLPYLCGDTNKDKTVNVSDAVFIINYVFVGGDPPNPLESGDANCDGDCNVSDAVWIINYVFVGGSQPCDTDGDGLPDC